MFKLEDGVLSHIYEKIKHFNYNIKYIFKLFTCTNLFYISSNLKNEDIIVEMIS